MLEPATIDSIKPSHVFHRISVFISTFSWCRHWRICCLLWQFSSIVGNCTMVEKEWTLFNHVLIDAFAAKASWQFHSLSCFSYILLPLMLPCLLFYVLYPNDFEDEVKLLESFFVFLCILVEEVLILKRLPEVNWEFIFNAKFTIYLQ